jgi:hypothetical protein
LKKKRNLKIRYVGGKWGKIDPVLSVNRSINKDEPESKEAQDGKGVTAIDKSSKQETNFANTVDRIAFYAFLLLFISFNFVYFNYYLNLHCN